MNDVTFYCGRTALFCKLEVELVFVRALDTRGGSNTTDWVYLSLFIFMILEIFHTATSPSIKKGTAGKNEQR